MNIIDAAHKTVHAYPGGSESLGPRIGMSPAVLRNKVNPNNTTHHLTLVEADEIMSVTGDFRILHALASQHGYLLSRSGKEEQGGSVLGLILEANICEGTFAAQLQAALGDGHISANEMRAIADAGTCVQKAIVSLLAKLSGQAA